MVVLPGCSMAILFATSQLQLNFIDVTMKLRNYCLTLAERQRRVTDTDQANPQCFAFSPQSSNWTIFFRDRTLGARGKFILEFS